MAAPPPQFSSLGKSTSDLIKKKFGDTDFKYTVQTKNKTASGLVFTTGGDFDSKKELTGNLKLNYKDANVGDFEGSIATSGPAKAELKLKKLVKGLTLIITADTHSKFIKDAKNASLKVQADYAQEFFAGSASAETKFWSPTVFSGSAVIGVDGLSVGAEVVLNTETIKPKGVQDYNVGAEYSAADFTATLKTEKQGANLTASYFHKINSDAVVGGELKLPIDGASTAREATLATEYKIDAATSVKVKGSTTKLATIAVEHRLPNPRVQIGFASQYEIVGFQAFNPKQFGLSFTFGDYDA